MKHKLYLEFALPLILQVCGCGSGHYLVQEKSLQMEAKSIPSWECVWTVDSSINDLSTLSLFSNDPISQSDVESFSMVFSAQVQDNLTSEYNFPMHINVLNRGKIVIRTHLIEFKKMKLNNNSSAGSAPNLMASPSSKNESWRTQTAEEWDRRKMKIGANVDVGELLASFYNNEGILLGQIKLKSKEKPIRPKDVAKEIQKLFNK